MVTYANWLWCQNWQVIDLNIYVFRDTEYNLKPTFSRIILFYLPCYGVLFFCFVFYHGKYSHENSNVKVTIEHHPLVSLTDWHWLAFILEIENTVWQFKLSWCWSGGSSGFWQVSVICTADGDGLPRPFSSWLWALDQRIHPCSWCPPGTPWWVLSGRMPRWRRRGRIGLWRRKIIVGPILLGWKLWTQALCWVPEALFCP